MSAKDTKRRSRFRLLNGGLHRRLAYEDLTIIAGPEHSPPFIPQAVVFEEDTFLVISARPKTVSEEHPIRLMTKLIETRPEPLGTVKVFGREPVRFLAVVLDLNQDPICRRHWVQTALDAVFEAAATHNISTLGLQPLGTLHGQLTMDAFAKVLAESLQNAQVPSLKKLWLMVSLSANRQLIQSLKDFLNK